MFFNRPGFQVQRQNVGTRISSHPQFSPRGSSGQKVELSFGVQFLGVISFPIQTAVHRLQQLASVTDCPTIIPVYHLDRPDRSTDRTWSGFDFGECGLVFIDDPNFSERIDGDNRLICSCSVEQIARRVIRLAAPTLSAIGAGVYTCRKQVTAITQRPSVKRIVHMDFVEPRDNQTADHLPARTSIDRFHHDSSASVYVRQIVTADNQPVLLIRKMDRFETKLDPSWHRPRAGRGVLADSAAHLTQHPRHVGGHRQLFFGDLFQIGCVFPALTTVGRFQNRTVFTNRPTQFFVDKEHIVQFDIGQPRAWDLRFRRLSDCRRHEGRYQKNNRCNTKDDSAERRRKNTVLTCHRNNSLDSNHRKCGGTLAATDGVIQESYFASNSN